MKIPLSFKPDTMTLKQLSDWFELNRPDVGKQEIEMTLAQEMWYRNLLPPEFMTVETVLFRGIPIRIYEV